VTPYDILRNAYGDKIAASVLASFRDIQTNFVLQRWKASELDSGHFVEAVRRIIQVELNGKPTPIGKPLPNFNDAELKRLENQTGNDSFRILMPRVLRSIYSLRSKRGVAHLGPISPNRMDSTLILYAVKWVLAELLRINSALDANDTQVLVDGIVQRDSPLIWDADGVKRVLAGNLRAQEKILVLLYDTSPMMLDGLRQSIEYGNATRFRTICSSLHSERLLEMSSSGKCTISPKGIAEAELILRNAD